MHIPRIHMHRPRHMPLPIHRLAPRIDQNDLGPLHPQRIQTIQAQKGKGRTHDYQL